MRSRKVIIIIISLCALYFLANPGIIGGVESAAGYMSVRTADPGNLEKMLQGMEEVQDMPAPLFNGHPLAYDVSCETYYTTQDMENDIWDGIFSSDSGELWWQEDSYFDSQEQAIAEGHRFTMYCIDKPSGCYRVCQIVFTGMPIMVIGTETGAPIGDELQTANVQVSDMKFGGKEYQSTACEVSVRGQSSRIFAKQGYKLVLDRKMSLLGMRRDEDWILAALWDDDGLIHNKFSYDVWRNIASDNSVAKDDGTTMEYVELFSNDIYMGVYGLVERIDAKELSLDKNDILYKCSGFAAPDEQIAGDFGLGTSYEIKYPKEYDSDVWMPLKEYLDIFASGQIQDYSSAAASLNMENAIDYNIFIILARACDNYAAKNTFYLAEYDRPAGAYKMTKVPWDCNATWGNGLYKGNFDRKLYNASWAHCAYVWSSDVKSLYQCRADEIRDMTEARWKELRQDILSNERLFRMLDEDFAYLHGSGAYDRNYVRWEEHGREHWKDEYIYEYLETRLAFLDAYFEEPYFDEVPLTEEDQ